MNAYTYTLYQALGIFIPLIVTNCIVIGHCGKRLPQKIPFYIPFLMGLLWDLA